MTDVNVKDLYQMFYEDPDFNGGLGGNPDDSKEEAAWDEAQSRFKQHKNNEKALKVGINQNKADEAKDDRKSFVRRKLLGKQQNPFAIATAKAKEMGYSDFSEGSEGNTKRGEIAEAIKEQKMKKQYNERAIKHKEKDMDTEMVVNSVLKDLASKGIIKSSVLQKDIPGLSRLGLSKEMSVPAIAGLVGAGAMLAKIFKLEDDGDDEHIAKQVVSYMEKNEDFFDGVGQLCEFVCQTKDGEEEGNESRGNRIMEAASEFHKQCGGAMPGGSGEVP